MMTAKPWTRKHIISLEDFTADEYDAVLTTASSFKSVLQSRTKKVPALQGQVVANMFFEPSTRTRSSFELAAKRLSADILNFTPGTSSLTKGETILDTAKTYWAMGANIMVIRHSNSGVPLNVAIALDQLNSGVSVFNGGDGLHQHPSQGLLDLFTICSLLDEKNPQVSLLKGKKVAIAGDILHSRVARSNINSLLTAGAQVHLTAPPTLLPALFAETVNSSDKGNLFIHWHLKPALEDADFVMTLRLQKERMTDYLLPSLREYHQLFGITHERLKWCNPNVKVLHPGPVNRGVELSSELMDDSQYSLIGEQVTNGVAVRMALLYLIGNYK